MSQIREQNKAPEKELSETEIRNLSDAEFQTLAIRMLNDLRENFNREIGSIKMEMEAIKKNQSEIKDTIMEMKTILHGINCRLNEAEDPTSDVEDKVAENTEPGQQKEKRIQKIEESLRGFWDNIKHINIRIIGVPEGEEREQGIENLSEEIMRENFPNLVKEIDIQAQKAQRVPNKISPKKPTPRHIIIKMQKVKDKERILKAAREKQLVTDKGAPIRLSADFSTETLQARRDWQEIFQVMKSIDLQPRLLYPARLSFRIEGQIRIFPDNKKLKEFITTK
uniref:L1 transposable element RRM domain-containing protein n=1 Tax=Rhinolophus ferrumequinum TaxID=59479 RepID=A0A671G8T5_RHIFE